MICHETVGQYPMLKRTGPSFRSSDGGPEDRLVNTFLASKPLTLSENLAVKVFREPRIEAGFPDIVLAVYEPTRSDGWSDARESLQTDDFRVLQGLMSLGRCGKQKLQSSLDWNIGPSLNRLYQAGLVYRATNTWGVRSLRDIFFLRRLIAVEAKIDDWSSGVRQANRNRWFASESYLLLGQDHISDELHQLCLKRGIGLLQTGSSLEEPVINGEVGNIPRSHVSWLFNNWSWKAHRHE